MSILYRILFKIDRWYKAKKLADIKSKFRFCGSNARIDPTCYILIPQNLEIGNNSSISAYTTIYAAYGVKIGDNCLISSNCGISSYNHIIHSANRPSQTDEDYKYSKPVVIGNNVWIGMNACILPGVSIGDNSIIGSGSVVTKNVPANEIWTGNPAICKKKLTI